MATLKIRVFKNGEEQPVTTVTIPTGVLKVAAKLIPKQAHDSLREQGMDLDELIRLATTPGQNGTLVEVEDHKKGERVMVSVE